MYLCMTIYNEQKTQSQQQSPILCMHQSINLYKAPKSTVTAPMYKETSIVPLNDIY